MGFLAPDLASARGSSSGTMAPPPADLKVLSLNVWLHKTDFEERMRKIVQGILQMDPSVVRRACQLPSQ